MSSPWLTATRWGMLTSDDVLGELGLEDAVGLLLAVQDGQQAAAVDRGRIIGGAGDVQDGRHDVRQADDRFQAAAGLGSRRAS